MNQSEALRNLRQMLCYQFVIIPKEVGLGYVKYRGFDTHQSCPFVIILNAQGKYVRGSVMLFKERQDKTQGGEGCTYVNMCICMYYTLCMFVLYICGGNSLQTSSVGDSNKIKP